MEIADIVGGQFASANTNAAPTDELGREDFLTMLIAQLENQDPLDPQDASAFTAQLAQFSSLDQLVSMRQAIDRLAGTSGVSDVVSASSLIGEEALVESSKVFIGKEGTPLPSVFLEVSDETEILSVELLNEDGRPVASASVGTRLAGQHELDWNDFSNIPPSDSYRLSVNVAPGETPPTTLVRGTVTGAVLSGSGAALQLAGLEVPLSSLREIGTDAKRDL